PIRQSRLASRFSSQRAPDRTPRARLLPPYRSCRHPGCARARREPPLEIGNELLGIKSIANRPPFLTERTHRRDIGRDLAWFAHGLRIVAGEDELGLRKFLKTEAHPVRAQFGGAVGPGPTGNVVIQPMLQVILERLPRASAMAGGGCGAPALARLKAAHAAQIAAGAARKEGGIGLLDWPFVRP